MTNLVKATLSVNYDLDAAGRIQLETEPGVSIDFSVFVRCYPANPDKIVTTKGTIETIGNMQRVVTDELVVFENSDRAVPAYPISGGFAWRSLTATFDADLNSISPTFAHDPLDGSVRAISVVTGAPVAIVGGIAISYISLYTRYRYRPLVSGTVSEYGAILAIKNGQVARLDLQSSFGNRPERAEIYRVISYVVVDNQDAPESAWEYPPGFPEDTSYGFTSDEPDADNSYVDHRAHEIGYVDRAGRTHFETFFHPNEKPYVGSFAYRPQYLFKQSSVPEEFEDARKEIDFTSVRTAVGERWPKMKDS